MLKRVCLLLLLFPMLAFPQGSRKDDVATKNLVTGLAAAPGALITVCTSAGVGVPCTPLANIYSDVGLTSLATNGSAANAVSCSIGPTTNPCLADSNGNYGFYASPGRYVVTVTGAGTTGKSVVYTLACDPSAACTVSGTTTLANVNNTLYISQFAGADLGAKMNTAVAQCATLGFASCRYIIDTNGTISTAPNFPMGSIVECAATGQITLSTTWTIAHRNTTFFFNGCQFNYNLDVGGSAFYIGKNASGTVNTQNAATGGCAANCATFATGTNFANIDQYDVVYINAAVYNVCSVQSATVLTLCAAPGTQTGVTYGARLTNSLIAGAPYTASVTIRDLNVTYTGAGTTTSIGVNNVLANQVDAQNVRASNFTGGQSVGWNMLGAEDYTVYKLILNSNKCQMVLDQGTIGGLNVSSSMNHFILPLLLNGGACTSPTTAAVTIQNSAFGNEFYKPDLEGNNSTYTFNILTSSFNNVIRGGDFETNGDGTASSIDVVIQSGTGNVVRDTRFTSLAVNKPATGLFCSGAGVFCTFENNVWGPASSYTTAWNFVSSAVGRIVANQPLAAAHGDPANTQDASGNYTLASIFMSGTIKNVSQATTMGLTLKKGSGAGNYTTASTTYVLADSTNLCFTVTIPTGWKLSVDASGNFGTATAAVIANVALTDNAACGTANAGILVEETETATGAGVLEPFALNWVITGDGNSHNVALQYKTSVGADVATLLNASATQLPTMVFTLMPSN